VYLSTDELRALRGFGELLNRELVEAVRQHAGSERYLFLGPIEIVIHEDPDLTRSTFAIESDLRQGRAARATGSFSRTGAGWGSPTRS